MLYNFRIDADQRDEVLRRVRDERLLCQGWGGGESGLDVRVPDFIAATRQAYALRTSRIPANLMRRISSFLDGDVLVTPHLPTYGAVSVHTVDGDFPNCYDPLTDDRRYHLNHRIRIRDSVGLNGEIPMGALTLGPWYAKVAWLRLPIMPMPQFERDFAHVLGEVRDTPDGRLDAADMERFLVDLTHRAHVAVHDALASMRPSGGAVSFERLCEQILIHNGYEIVARNHYDRKGGDADLICERRRSDGSPFEDGVLRLYVQVKRHNVVTDEEPVKQLIRLLEVEGGDGCVMTLADSFSNTAKTLAKQKEIRLIARPELEVLLLGLLASRAREAS